MAKFTRRSYKRKSFRRPKKMYFKRKSLKVRNKQKQKKYETYRIAVKTINEVAKLPGDIDPYISAYVPWYFEEYKAAERSLEGVVD